MQEFVKGDKVIFTDKDTYGKAFEQQLAKKEIESLNGTVLTVIKKTTNCKNQLMYSTLMSNGNEFCVYPEEIELA